MIAYLLQITCLLIAIFVLQQSLEQFKLNSLAFQKNRPWQWPSLRKDFWNLPSWLEFVFEKAIPHPLFSLSRVALAICLMAVSIEILILLPLELDPRWLTPKTFQSQIWMVWFLVISQFLLCLRWRGNFNGGSDHMSLIVLITTGLALLPMSHKISEGAFLYLGVQSTLSYFISGWIKIKKRNWREGKALTEFLKQSIYKPGPLEKKISSHSGFSQILSWFTMIFEMSIVLALFFPNVLMAYLALAACFHLANFYFFGLNRFFWVWISTYPAVIHLSYFMTHSL